MEETNRIFIGIFDEPLSDEEESHRSEVLEGESGVRTYPATRFLEGTPHGLGDLGVNLTLNIRKKYKNDFKKALGSDERVNKAMGADRAFMSMIKDELQNRKGGKPGSKKKGNGSPPPPPPPGQE